VRVLKLLTVPAVLLVTALTAVPALAHHFTNVTVSQTCDTSNGRICVRLQGNVATGNDERTMFLDLFGQNGTGEPVKVGEVTFVLPANHTQSSVPLDQTVCFAAVNQTFDHFLVKWVGVTNHAGQDADLTIQIGDRTITQSQLPATLVTSIAPCTAKTTTASTVREKPASAPPSTPVSNTTTALAQTGGLDYRLPLIGLTVLAAGLAIVLVGASRARRSMTDE
jgi:hypothetical protein